ncbi:MAG: hypothetical protein ACKN9U_27255, partial [Pirellulaceae bacterium]
GHSSKSRLISSRGLSGRRIQNTVEATPEDASVLRAIPHCKNLHWTKERSTFFDSGDKKTASV